MNYQNKFDELLSKIERPGIGNLKEWLSTTDFYEAPASTRFHGACKGGLVAHTVHVAENLLKLANFYCPNKYPEETLLLVALCHDFCKINTYKIDMRNVKNDKGFWEKKPYYARAEEMPMCGHGSKSMYLTMFFIQLSRVEASAIMSHMGAWDISTYNQPGEVFSWNELAWLLHVADERATYKEDVENDNR